MAVHRRAHPPLLPEKVGRYVLLLGLISVPGLVWSQDQGAVFRDHDWGGRAVWQEEWNAPSDGTEILSDDLSIRFKNNKPEFLALFFERKQVIRFGSEEEILRHGRFTLPQSLDPPYDRRSVPWANRGDPPRPNWFNVRLDAFAARIVHPDGTWGEVGVFASVDKDRVRTIRSTETAWTYVLDMQSISPGDVVEVHWKYMIPYDANAPYTRGWRGFEWMDNWARLTSWRIFFHGEVPVREQRVEIQYHLKHGLVLAGALPNERTVKGSDVTVTWVNKNLPGCMAEVNARPAEDLPHIIVKLMPEDLRYWRRDRLSRLPLEQPYWLQVIRQREARALWWQRVARKRVPDRQNQLVRDFIERVSGHVADSLLTRKIELVHEYIASRFRYEDDAAWYMDLDNAPARIGEQMQDERIRDISRYDMYSKVLNHFRADHVTAYVLDKRIGAMNDHYMTPLWDSEYLFGIGDASSVLWMHPKRSQFGLMANELPFYWQGTGALLVDLDLLLEDLPPPPLFTDLPMEDPEGNLRVHEYVLEVDPSSTVVTGSVRVLLSGQFSTLGRAAYLDMAMDSTVDPLYGWRPTDGPGVSSSGWDKVEFSTDPPFRFRTQAALELEGAIKQEADSTYVMDLAPFIAHVVPDGLSSEDRTLPFHWDIAQDDRFRFELRLSQPVKLLNAEALEVQIAASGCGLESHVRSQDPTTMIFEQKLVVEQERLMLDAIPGLESVLDGAVRSVPLRFKLVDLAN